MNRRKFFAFFGGAVLWARAARGQQPPIAKLGMLWPGGAYPAPPRMPDFELALRQLGFSEGDNLSIELRYARGGPQELAGLAGELVGMNLDAIMAFGDLAPKILHEQTKDIPIVAISDDILATG